MSELWSQSNHQGEVDSTRIDVSNVDEIYVEGDGYVYVESVE